MTVTDLPRIDLDALKARLPAYLDKIGVPYTVRGQKLNCRCPLHEDRHPSFEASLKAGAWLWFCHPCNAGGTVIDLHMARTGLAEGDAISELGAMFGDCTELTLTKPLPVRTVDRVEASGPSMPIDATAGTEADWRELAALRHLTVFAPATAAKLGTLYFGPVCGFRCWILTDKRRLIAEARRMDGKLFPAIGTLRERKAHTIRGSAKSWPVGIMVRGFTAADFRAVLAVEGGPDYLAALDRTLAGKSDCLPIALLGAGAANEIHPEALDLLRGRRVRFYPHHEASGRGTSAAERWAAQLAGVGATLDGFSFDGLRKVDGSPVKDLNDCAEIHPDDADKLEELLP